MANTFSNMSACPPEAGARGGRRDGLDPGQLLRPQHQLPRWPGHGQLPMGRQVAGWQGYRT